MESVLKGKIAPSLSARFFVGSAGKAYPADRYRLSPATAEIPGAQKGVTAHLYHVLVSLGTVGAPAGSILAAVRSGERGHLPLLTGERAPFAILDQLSCWYPACTAGSMWPSPLSQPWYFSAARFPAAAYIFSWLYHRSVKYILLNEYSFVGILNPSAISLKKENTASCFFPF